MLGCDSDCVGKGVTRSGGGGVAVVLKGGAVAAAAAALMLGVDLAGRGESNAERRLAAPKGEKYVRVGDAGVTVLALVFVLVLLLLASLFLKASS